MSKRRKTKSSFRPQAAIRHKGTTTYLHKDPNQKGRLIPYTQVEQDKYLEPEPQKEKAWEKECRTGAKVVNLDKKLAGRHRKRIKKSSRKQRKHACRTLCSSLDMMPEPTPAWKFLLLCILALVLDLVFPNIPRVPAVWLQNIPEVPEPIQAILRAVHGPELAKRHGTELKRPCCLNAYVPLGAALPSSRMEDYLGGSISLDGKEKRLWIPLQRTMFVIASNVPKPVRETAVACSPLAIPAFCTKFSSTERLIISLDGVAFQTFDTDMLKQLKAESTLISAELFEFTRWLRKKEKRWKNCMESVGQFRSRSYSGRYVSLHVTEETILFSIALAIFKAFLYYASVEKQWLTPEEAQEILSSAWAHVLPETASKGTGSEADGIALDCYDPAVFYQFLGTWFLPTYQDQILRSSKGDAGTMALVHQIDSTEWLIVPREKFAEGYAKWLAEKNADTPWCSEAKPGAFLQRKLQEAGIPLRGEKGNPSTWRYAFYARDKKHISCFAIPTADLPETVQQRLGDLIRSSLAASIVPNPSEGETNHEEGGKAL